MEHSILLLISTIAIGIILIIILSQRLIRCPAGKILVISGFWIDSEDDVIEVLAGGSKFVFPIIQNYSFIDLGPYSIEINEKIYTKDEICVEPRIKITFGVSNSPDLISKAGTYLISLSTEDIAKITKDICSMEIEKFVKTIDIVDLSIKRRDNKLVPEICETLSMELNKLGIEIINVKISSIPNVEEQIAILETNHKRSIPELTVDIKSKNEIQNELKKINEALNLLEINKNELLNQKLQMLKKLR